jgi:hypothetical protein
MLITLTSTPYQKVIEKIEEFENFDELPQLRTTVEKESEEGRQKIFQNKLALIPKTNV